MLIAPYIALVVAGFVLFIIGLLFNDEERHLTAIILPLSAGILFFVLAISGFSIGQPYCLMQTNNVTVLNVSVNETINTYSETAACGVNNIRSTELVYLFFGLGSLAIFISFLRIAAALQHNLGGRE